MDTVNINYLRARKEYKEFVKDYATQYGIQLPKFEEEFRDLQHTEWSSAMIYLRMAAGIEVLESKGMKLAVKLKKKVRAQIIDFDVLKAAKETNSTYTDVFGKILHEQEGFRSRNERVDTDELVEGFMQLSEAKEL